MSDLARLQQLAEAVGWKIRAMRTPTTEVVRNEYEVSYGCGQCRYYDSLAPIAARLEAEYRKMAVQAQNARRVYLKISNWCGGDTSDEARYLTRIADELAVKEPTMVEKLREINHWSTYSDFVTLVRGALLDLYERKEPR